MQGHPQSGEPQDEVLSPGGDTTLLPGLGGPRRAARMDPGERKGTCERELSRDWRRIKQLTVRAGLGRKSEKRHLLALFSCSPNQSSLGYLKRLPWVGQIKQQCTFQCKLPAGSTRTHSRQATLCQTQRRDPVGLYQLVRGLSPFSWYTPGPGPHASSEA